MNAIRQTFEPQSEREGALQEPISVIAIGLEDTSMELLEHFLTSVPQVRLQASLQMSRNDELVRFLDQNGLRADVCLVDFDRDQAQATLVTKRIHALAPEVAVFAVSSYAQPNAIIEAMRSGCSEYLVKPINQQDLMKGLARAAAHKKEAQKLSHSQVITFIGAKGGCGVTTLVTQMGAALASSCSRKTLLLDLHRDMGDAALYLGLTKHLYNSLELIENADRLDGEFLQSFLAHHSSGLELIPAPEGGDASWNVAPAEITKVLDFLRRTYEFILLDLPPRLSQQNLELVRYSERVYLITVPEVSALRNVVRQMEYFARNNIAEDRIRVVLNRHHKRSPLTDGEIEKAIRTRIFWKIPNQYAQVVKTISGGNPIAQLSSSEVMRSINEWAASLGSKDSVVKKSETRGIFGRWSR